MTRRTKGGSRMTQRYTRTQVCTAPSASLSTQSARALDSSSASADAPCPGVALAGRYRLCVHVSSSCDAQLCAGTRWATDSRIYLWHSQVRALWCFALSLIDAIGTLLRASHSKPFKCNISMRSSTALEIIRVAYSKYSVEPPSQL
jgi:hypothetical protein